MRSASAKGALVVLSSLLLAGALTACETSQETAARLNVRSKRILVGRRPVEIRKVDRRVRVVKTAIVRDKREAAIVVELRNAGRKPVAALPLAVGVRTATGKATQLNRRPGTFDNGHTPALAPGHRGTWVFKSKDPVEEAGTAFARVGVPERPKFAVEGALPRIKVSHVVSSRVGKATRVQAQISNDAGFPQYDLTVYAWAEKAGRFTAAGRASLEHLGTGETERVSLTLIGDPHGAKLHVSAPPTIFE